MAGKTDPSRMNRIVALLPAGAANRLSMNLVRVGSGYEAAAELLSGPASALLVDLAMLTGRHGPLLKLAAELNVPVVAFGTISAALDGSVLAGVNLVGAEQAAEVLRSLVNGEAGVEEPVGLPSAKEAPMRFDGAHRGRFEKPLTQEELDALLSD